MLKDGTDRIILTVKSIVTNKSHNYTHMQNS